jgi:hypothetical protein
MRYSVNFVLGAVAVMSVACTATPSSVAANHYQVKLPPELWADIHTYAKLAHFNKKESAIILNWTAVYDGTVAYVLSTHSYPNHFPNYPLFWTYADSTLVFVYDNKYPNLLVDSLALKKEVDSAIKMSGVALSKRTDFVEDNLSLRFITAHGQQRIDTSSLYVKMCQ